MATIRSLLNPISSNEEAQQNHRPSSLSNTHLALAVPNFDQAYTPSSQHSRKKQKICKDAAIFKKSPLRGDCRYPPKEFQDDKLKVFHERFEVYPMGEIAQYPRHIPYNSEKKSFLEKTGRECLEVFQYRFRVPGDAITYTMLWDYNIGLVRTTPLFKCCGYSKTTPAKMLNRNPGLREICHSITGGALVAQGYWMPYDAAKAVAATFCWSIRYALTPVFGLDFVDLCIKPDSDKYGEMLIDPKVTRQCTEQAKHYREIEGYLSSRASSALPSPSTPNSPIYTRHIEQMHHKGLKIASTNSDYSTDTGYEDNYILDSEKTQMPSRKIWTAANSPRSVPRFDTRPSVHKVHATGTHGKISKKRLADSSSSSSSQSSSELSSPAISPKTRLMEADENYEGDSSSESSSEIDVSPTIGARPSRQLPTEEKAAYLLMSLKLQGVQTDTGSRGHKRRASA